MIARFLAARRRRRFLELMAQERAKRAILMSKFKRAIVWEGDSHAIAPVGGWTFVLERKWFGWSPIQKFALSRSAFNYVNEITLARA